ncbi:YggS family pyridoxal phosphate-dependent enzyme [Bacterioplanes sanyensis]|uniref:Pyridoxal phosphate homeostasis protein n=1 Tax=Bacterioplanes sanyensis TaxID=1249553 RepID=A0A222FHT5_9GAMM|nr:YggS family pyridoxal phosphate-dependent enzyme [Bacterioplanes sanyensis]ASP38146.1 YggS family pyridoxal phosphate-dependent enzyme [Bacterioplanes sanyensis]
MSTLEQRYHAVQQRIDSACQSAGRQRAEVALLAVSKTKPATMVRDCYQLGQRAFGENYLQDAMDKISQLADLDDIQWHFIGHLQSNKSKTVAEHFHWLETLDRIKLARRLNEQRPQTLPPLNVLLQVNISQEVQKSGVAPADVAELAAHIAELPRLTLRGLMCIPEATDNADALATQFDHMQTLLAQLQPQHPSADTLSMGMSGDLELAIAHGSHQVRVGTDIFGARSKAD